MAVAAITGQAPPPMPERGRTWSVYDLFTTADAQQIFIGITSERHWQRMCIIFGFSDWQSDERLASNQSRIDERHWFLRELQKRLGVLTKDELIQLAEKAGIPYAQVNRPEDLLTDPHLTGSGGLADTQLPEGGLAKLPKIPLRLDEKSFELRHHPPQVGQGAKELLKQCGLTNKDIADLSDEGVIYIHEPEA
jgi:crotonobetainyl-CoA:carnitine CoA-transferase CaiB-like acyl-CoA transferase